MPIPVGDDAESRPYVTLTISVGVATLDGERRELTDTLAAADAALYHAKVTNRNKTHVITTHRLTNQSDPPEIHDRGLIPGFTWRPAPDSVTLTRTLEALHPTCGNDAHFRASRERRSCDRAGSAVIVANRSSSGPCEGPAAANQSQSRIRRTGQIAPKVP